MNDQSAEVRQRENRLPVPQVKCIQHGPSRRRQEQQGLSALLAMHRENET